MSNQIEIITPVIRNRAVSRNQGRFPSDFVRQLTAAEYENLKCQIGITSSHGGRRTPPYAFTEHGAIMAANVLNSPDAVRIRREVHGRKK